MNPESIYRGDAKCALHLDWNRPVVSRADNILRDFLDGWLGSIGRWHFETGTNKIYTSEVVDGKKSEVTRLSL